MTATVYIHKIPSTGPLPNKSLQDLERYLAKQPDRNEFILSKIIEDVTNGEVVLLPLRYLEQMGDIASLLNKKLETGTCASITASQTVHVRQAALKDIRDGNVKVILVTTAVLGMGGLDLRKTCDPTREPVWTKYYQIFPKLNLFPAWASNKDIRLFFDEGSPAPLVQRLKENVRSYLEHGYRVNPYDLQEHEIQATLPEKDNNASLTGEEL